MSWNIEDWIDVQTGEFTTTKDISLGVCTYNLKKIGRQILKQQREAAVDIKEQLLKAA